MTTKWVEANKSEGQQAERMPEGYHRAKVAKVLRKKKDGSEFRTEKGPFLLLVMENGQGEAATNLFLTPKAAWKAAKVFSRLGLDLEKMEAAGVDISRFEDEAFASKQLVGREAFINVEHDGKYANVEFYHEDELPFDELARLKAPAASRSGDKHQPVDESEIPF